MVDRGTELLTQFAEARIGEFAKTFARIEIGNSHFWGDQYKNDGFVLIHPLQFGGV